MKNKHVDDYCDALDASVFSGDFLLTRSDLIEFEGFLKRWQLEVDNYKTMVYYDESGTLRNPDGSISIYDDVDE